MAENTSQTFEHVLELTSGETGQIEFRFPKDRRTSFRIKLAAADPAAGTVELGLDNFTRGYEMYKFSDEDDARWTPLLPDDDGRVSATLDFDRGERAGITSDDQFSHSLSLVDAAWQGDRLRLTFREEA